MTTTSGSLAAAFESSGIKEVVADPIIPAAEGNEPSGGIVIPPMKDPADIQIPFITDEPVKVEGNEQPVAEGGETDPESDADQIDYIKDFAAALEYEGEVEGSTFEDFKKIGQAAIAQYKEKVNELTNMFSPDLVEHIKAGGTVETFYQYPQETNYYQDAKFEEDDVENREALVSDYYLNQGIEQDQVEMLVNNLKEKGTFNAFSDKVLDQYKALEKAENEKVVAQRKADEAESLKKRNELITGVTESFEKGLPGVTADKEVLEAAKVASLPDAKGQFAIHNIKLTPAQEATVNAFVIALSKGKSFAYAPTKATATQSSGVKPIAQIFNKQNNSGKNPQIVNTLEEMNQHFGSRKNLN